MKSFVAITFLINVGIISSQDSNFKIIGGKPSDIRQRPYQVSIQLSENGQHFCGGAIITDDIILTAAHCTNGLFGKKLQIRAGSVYYKSGGQIVPVAFYKEHEKFNSFLLTNDISLLKLSKKLNFNENVQPISIAKSIRSIKDGAMGTVSGWGDQTEDGWGSSRLLEVEIPLITFNKCKNYYGQKLFVTMFCAGYEEGGMDACQGDSGGVLVSENKIVGIVSWGYGCARAFYPGIYTNVPLYYTWIQKTIHNFL